MKPTILICGILALLGTAFTSQARDPFAFARNPWLVVKHVADPAPVIPAAAPAEPTVAATPSYEQALAEALQEHAPLVVGVGTTPPQGRWLATRQNSLEGFPAPCIVLALPYQDKYMAHAATLPASATARDVAKAIMAGFQVATVSTCPCGPNCPAGGCTNGQCGLAGCGVPQQTFQPYFGGFFGGGGCAGGCCGGRCR